MLANPTVTIAIGFVEPRVVSIVHLSTGICLQSCLNLDIHIAAKICKIEHIGKCQCTTQLGVSKRFRVF